MEKLTKAEEEIMQLIWKLERCLVRDIVEELEQGDQKIPHSTVSSIVRILEKKGYVWHKAYGRTYEYYPLISKSIYSKRVLEGFIEKYFKGSAKKLVSFLVQEKDLSVHELGNLMNDLEEDAEDNKKNKK